MAATLFVLVPSAVGSGADQYSATITPSSVVEGTSQTYTVTLTNDSQNTDTIASAQITADASFTVTGATNVSPSTWTIDPLSGNVVTLRASGGDEIGPGASVSVDITADAPASRSTFTWATAADSSSGSDFSTPDFGNSGADPTVTVTGAATHLVLAAASTTPSAGQADNLTITAEDDTNETVGSYTGDKNLKFGGASVALDGTHHPTVTDKGGNAVNFGGSTTLTFTNGVASVSGSNNGVMTLYKAEAANVTVTDNTISNSGLAVTVGPAAASQFVLTPSTASPTAGASLSVAFSALDPYGNVDTNYSGSKTIDYSGPHSSPGPVVTAPLYPASATSVTFASGVANGGASASGIKLYDAESVSLIATEHGTSVSGSTPLTVGPATASQYKVPTPGTQVAGTSFNETLTALDPYGNTDTNYSGNKSLTWGGSPCSPNCPGTAPDATHTPSYPSNPVNFSGGQATVSITLFKAESPKLGVTDGTISGSSNTFTVDPGTLGSFTVKSSTNGTIATQTAGVAFGITATAFDIFLNQKTNYTGSQNAQLTGTFGHSSRGCDNTGTPTPGGTGQCSAFYGNGGSLGTWTNGVATPSVTAFLAQTGQTLTVKDGNGNNAPQGTSNAFAVNNNEPDGAPRGVKFTVQPGLSLFNAPLTGPPTVKVEDAFGNAVPNRAVTMTISQFAAGASQTFTAGSTPSVLTNSSGLAAFTNLNIQLASVNYEIRATVNVNPSGTVIADSSAFDVANDLKGCNGTSPTCQGNQASSDNKTFSTVTVTSTTGVNLTGSLGTAVSTSIVAPTTLPAGVCTGLGGKGFGVSLGISGTAADFPSNPTTAPTFTIVTRIDKSLVKAKPQPNGATSFDICLGAVNTLTGLINGHNECANANTDPSFPAKGGGCAVRATASDGTDAYWAVLPDGPSNAKSCLDSRIKFPVVLSKTKNGAGDVILTTCVPYPRDPHPVGGP